jgi:hypothetical protein
VPVLPAGEVGQDKGDGTRADLLTPAASDVSTDRSSTYSFGLNPETSGRDSLSPGKYDHPRDFSIFRED